MTAYPVGPKLTAARLHPAVVSHLSYIAACANDHVLAIREGQLDCDFCPVRMQCLDSWDNRVGVGNGGPAFPCRLDTLRRSKLITTLILILTLFQKGLTPYERDSHHRTPRGGLKP